MTPEVAIKYEPDQALVLGCTSTAGLHPLITHHFSLLRSYSSFWTKQAFLPGFMPICSLQIRGCILTET